VRTLPQDSAFSETAMSVTPTNMLLSRQLTQDELGMLCATLLATMVPDDLETLAGTLGTALDDLCECGHVLRRHRFGPCTAMADNRARRGIVACRCQTFVQFDYKRGWKAK